MLLKRNKDARKFFYLNENVITKALPDTTKSNSIVAYLGVVQQKYSWIDRSCSINANQANSIQRMIGYGA